MKKTIWTFILIVLATFLVGYLWWQNALGAVSSDKQSLRSDDLKSTKVLIIPKGEGISSIADQLKKENLIKSSLAFKIYAKLNNLSGKIQAGSFKLSPSMTLKEIAENMSKGTNDVWVTFIEGWRVEEDAEELAKYFGDNSEKFVTNSREGYMFPDTYLFPKEATMEFVASTLKNTFDQKYTPDLQAKIKALGLTPDEGVVLASIVEREARTDGVRTEVASILLKRFNIGMALDVDSTVQYALGYQPSEKSWWKKQITADDKKITSPYNTYQHVGLPPNPICNPSLSSLKAVANANPNTPYLYYYHDAQGNSYYAKTLEEHNQNVANYP